MSTGLDGIEAVPAALRVESLALGYAGEPVVEGVELDVAPGEIVVVLGHSGCGKSTLLRAIAGLLRPLSGRVVHDGRTVTGPHADRALVFQADGAPRSGWRGWGSPATPTGFRASSRVACASGSNSPGPWPARRA
jgi:energy-coupling factor transporter ATP-binding protein EcfA2